MPKPEIVLTMEWVSEPERGIWCNGCSLPSVVRGIMALRQGDKLLHVGSYERCLGNCPDENELVEGQ